MRILFFSLGYFNELSAKVSGLNGLIDDIRISKSVDRSMYVAKYDQQFKAIAEALKQSMAEDKTLEAKADQNQKAIKDIREELKVVREKVSL